MKLNAAEQPAWPEGSTFDPWHGPMTRPRKKAIYRIRQYSGRKGRPNFYYHADVLAYNGKEALKAAREGRVHNWRWIDSFDTATRDYCSYALLASRVPPDWARNVAEPTPAK